MTMNASTEEKLTRAFWAILENEGVFDCYDVVTLKQTKTEIGNFTTAGKYCCEIRSKPPKMKEMRELLENLKVYVDELIKEYEK